MSDSSETSPLKEAFREGVGFSELSGKYLDIPDVSGKKTDRARANNEYTPSVADEVIRQDLIDSGHSPFHGESDPQFRIEKEKPEHRMLVFLFAQGMSLKEVFEQCGGEWSDGKPVSGTGKWSYPYLCQIRRQPWFQSLLVRYMEEAGKDRISAAIEAEFSRSFEVVCEIRDNPAEKGSTRLAAASSIIDRFLGKPTQHIKSEIIRTVSDYTNDADRLAAELFTLEAEIVSLNPGALVTS